ncbi:pitrilysin family protein [Bacteriovorax sp. Seq25_V]|uniref:M16 family metallopeptidase n=1 Tax=Bacteriovorax sp. Seq25_V TaxID=1201288 RepID=UPI00038A54E0|nr:pitrilysin family protein [Bacteriovorax sp. Seq25_V]EQC46892.1 peptidase, M16 family [Bacteriovorax sp. Seq25_V]
MKYEIDRLKNNLEVIFVDLPGSNVATAQIWFRAGSTLEAREDHGIAHFLEHMFFKGTQTRPGAAIAHEVESFGGEINAFTSFDYTCYYINTPNSNLNQTLDILLDMVSNPQFKIEDLIPEREVVFEEFRRSIDSPNQYSFHKIQKSSFTGGYAHAILGNEKTIKNFSREQLMNFREKYYNSSNSFLVVAGDISRKEEIIKKIESFELPNGNAAKKPSFKLKSKPTIEMHNKDVRMGQLSLTIQSPGMDHKSAAAEDLAYNTLGHGESSPLHKALVLKDSIANHCASSTMFFCEGGIHFLRINFPVENYKKVIKLLEDTLGNIIKNGISSEDITKIKNQYIASKVYSKESIESFAFALGSSYAQTENIESENIFIERIRKTTLKEVNAAYQDIFSRPMHISLQLPKSEQLENYKKPLETLSKNISRHTKPIKSENYKVTKSKYDPNTSLYEVIPGINLLYRHNPMTPTFVLHAYLKGGITEETQKTSGIYSITASLLTKGYKGVSQEALRHDLENKSASLSHFSGKNAFGLTMHGQTDHFKELSNHFLKSLMEPSFQQKHLTHEIKMIKRSLDAQKEDATKNCFRLATEKLFAGHPYGQSIIGTEDSIKKIKRADIVKLHDDNLKKREILFTYCGDLTAEEVIEEIKLHTKSLKARKIVKLKAKPVKKLKAETLHLDFDREQTQIFIGTQTKSLSSKENTVLKMITTHLSGQSSELFVDVRDRKGLCYVAQPVHMNALEAGYWGIYMASGHDKVEAAIDAIKTIIDRLSKEGLSKQDFDRIKIMIEGQNQLNLQVNDDYANVYSVPTLQGKGLDYFHESNKEISTLKYADFQKELKSAFSKNWITVTVGR